MANIPNQGEIQTYLSVESNRGFLHGQICGLKQKNLCSTSIKMRESSHRSNHKVNFMRKGGHVVMSSMYLFTKELHVIAQLYLEFLYDSSFLICINERVLNAVTSFLIGTLLNTLSCK